MKETKEERQLAPMPAPVEIYVRNASDTVIAGLVGKTHDPRGWLEVNVVWVEEEFRAKGLGRELIERAEKEAMRRGCTFSRLATVDFQAPGFCQKVGYRREGNAPNDCYAKELSAQVEETENSSVPPLRH